MIYTNVFHDTAHLFLYNLISTNSDLLSSLSMNKWRAERVE